MANKWHIESAIEWLKRAQNVKDDGGVSSWYSLLTGWAPSYVETTGYIISTFLAASKYLKEPKLLERAVKMADYLLLMQLPNGSFKPQPRVFNTGQVLLGLVDVYRTTSKQKYLDAAISTADWLCEVQEKDGSWVRHTYGNVSHTYHTRVAWSLLKTYDVLKKNKYKKAAFANLQWASKNQLKNGWFKQNGLPEFGDKTPFTHTISYALEGFLFSALLQDNESWLETVRRGLDPIIDHYSKNNYLSGTFDNKWSSVDRYSCLPGDSQLSVVSWNMYSKTGDSKYKAFGHSINSYLKTKQKNTSKNKNVFGGLAGSDPIYGDLLRMKGYSRMAYVNWAAKFFVDALILEEKLTK